MPEYLTSSQLKRLKEHKYSASGVTFLEPYLQVFWKWLVEQVPLWWAPNSITTAGLLANILTTAILISYSPDCIKEAPRWCYFLCALGLFIYQSLDSIDGKQARRTKTNTPLGELFDHGCDSLSTVFIVISICIAMRLGQEPGWLFFEFFGAMFMFYVIHWQTYVSGTLRFEKFDHNEVHYVVILVHLISTFSGPSSWDIEIPTFGLPAKMLTVYSSMIALVFQCLSKVYSIFFKGGIGKNGSTVAGTSTIFPVLPITLVITFALVVYKKSPLLFEDNPCLYTMAFGLVAVKIINKLLIATMTKSEMEWWDSSYIGPLLLIINQYFNTPVNEYLVLWICFIYTAANLTRYSIYICQDICDYLNIYCFSITPRPRLDPQPYK